MKKVLLLVVLCCCFLSDSYSIPAYAFRVKFKDKNGTLTFADSLLFLSPKSLARRAFQGIQLDSSDLPVVKPYIDTVMITGAGIKLHNVSKWFNQIVIINNDSSKAADIAALPMVASVKCVGVYPNGNFSLAQPQTKFPEIQLVSNKVTGSPLYYGLTYQQVDILEADCLHDMGYKGEGMDIAVFDVNFRYTDSCSAFDSVRLQNRIKDVYNFVKDTAWVFSKQINSDHGMNVLGCMAANLPGTYVGTAPQANFYLYNTEDIGGERPIEEDNWLSAAERVDSLGVYVVNSSLGYNIYNSPLGSSSYTYADLDGNTTMITQAANKLASKGILLVQAQGNEGGSAWHYLLAPADADSAYSVGSCDGSGLWAGSGYGPNAGGRTKPDGLALGKDAMLMGGNCIPGTSNGSSFASPMMCGAMACLWQSLPSLPAWKIRQAVRMSSDHYSAPNNTHGYGIPNFCNAYNIATNTSDIQQIDYTYAVYPNPNQDGQIKVKSFQPNANNFSYAIYDMQGRCIDKSTKLYKTEFYSSALQNALPGNYVLIISTANKMYSTTLTKK